MIIPLLVSIITVAMAAESESTCCVEKEVGTIKYKVMNFLDISLILTHFYTFKLLREDVEETSKFGCQEKRIFFSFPLSF